MKRKEVQNRASS